MQRLPSLDIQGILASTAWWVEYLYQILLFALVATLSIEWIISNVSWITCLHLGNCTNSVAALAAWLQFVSIVSCLASKRSQWWHVFRVIVRGNLRCYVWVGTAQCWMLKVYSWSFWIHRAICPLASLKLKSHRRAEWSVWMTEILCNHLFSSLLCLRQHSSYCQITRICIIMEYEGDFW